MVMPPCGRYSKQTINYRDKQTRSLTCPQGWPDPISVRLSKTYLGRTPRFPERVCCLKEQGPSKEAADTVRKPCPEGPHRTWINRQEPQDHKFIQSQGNQPEAHQYGSGQKKQLCAQLTKQHGLANQTSGQRSEEEGFTTIRKLLLAND